MKWLVAGCAAFATTCGAAELTGRVVGISDGDTITVLDASNTQHKIRLAGIDAPELKQAFGTRSKQNLSRMTYDMDARLECHKTDRYQREVCKVWVQPSDCPTCGMTLDAGHAQIIAGLAWWYRHTQERNQPTTRAAMSPRRMRLDCGSGVYGGTRSRRRRGSGVRPNTRAK